jgi:hypothetical protein
VIGPGLPFGMAAKDLDLGGVPIVATVGGPGREVPPPTKAGSLRTKELVR